MNSYRQARSSALKELADAAKQKEMLDKRIARLKQTVASLDALIEGDESSVESRQEMQVVGITDAVRNALKIANSPRTAVDVRDWLANSGYDLSDQENALASIHTILKRLVKSGEAQDGLNEAGKAVYKWVGIRQTLMEIGAQQQYKAAIAIQQALAGIRSQSASEALVKIQQDILAAASVLPLTLSNPPYAQPHKQTQKTDASTKKKERIAKIDRELRERVAREALTKKDE